MAMIKLTLEPANVFLLLLDLNVVGNHVGELGVDASLLEVALEEGLQVLVKVLERRTSVEALSGPVLLGSLGVGEVGLGEVRHLLDLEETILGNGLDQERTVAGLFDGDVDTSRKAGLHITVQIVHFAVSRSNAILGVLSNSTGGTATLVSGLVALEVHLIGESAVIEILLFAQVLKVGDREGESDPVRRWKY
jgi:hypothetical protein